MNRYTLIGMVLGAAAATGIWLFVSSLNQALREVRGVGPEVVVQRWLDAARTVDVDGMIELTRDPNLRQEIDDQRYMIQRLVQEDPARAAADGEGTGETASPTAGFDFRYTLIKERTVEEGDTAAVVVRLQRRGASILRQFRLSRRDGMWKVDGWTNIEAGTEPADEATPGDGGEGPDGVDDDAVTADDADSTTDSEGTDSGTGEDTDTGDRDGSDAPDDPSDGTDGSE